MSKVLLTSADYIKANTELLGNVEPEKILPALQYSQDIELQYVIGSSLLSKLQDLVGTGDITKDENSYYKELIDNYIQPYLSYLTISRLTLVLGQKLSNMGVVENTDEHSQNMSFEDRQQLGDYYKNMADSYCGLLQRYIIKNIAQFPELNQDDVLNIKSNLSSSADCSIWLGGSRNPERKYGRPHRPDYLDR